MAPTIIKYFLETVTLTLTLTLNLTLTLTLMECLKFDNFYDTHFERVMFTQMLENYLGTGVGFAEDP